MAICDTIEMTEGWPLERVAETDRLLANDGLPTLTEMRVRFSKEIRRVLNHSSIKNEVSISALRNAAELAHDSGKGLWALLAAYGSSKKANVHYGSFPATNQRERRNLTLGPFGCDLRRMWHAFLPLHCNARRPIICRLGLRVRHGAVRSRVFTGKTQLR